MEVEWERFELLVKINGKDAIAFTNGQNEKA